MALRRPVAITPPLRRPRARISPAEWRWLALVGGILLLATVPPIVIAALQVPAGEVFPGYVVIARDAYVYQALWHAGASGDWLFRSRYTAEPLPGVLLYPWYLWGGHLLGGLPSAWLYHATRLLAVLTIAAWSATRRLRRPGLFAIAAALMQAPYLAYLIALMRSHPLALAVVRSVLDVGDPFGFLVLSHLAATVLIVVGLLSRRVRGDLILPGFWILGMTLFMFTPGISASLGRSFMASSIPFGLCAVPGLVVLLRRLRTRRWRRRALSAMLAVAGFYGLVSLAQPVWIAAFRLDPKAEYENRGEANLLAWLAPRVSPRDLVLTTYLDGLFVPAQTNARVYAGHPDMTIDAPRKASEALDFFQSWAADRRDAFLHANGIDFVLTSDPGAVTRLETDPALRVVDRDGPSVLFQVTP